MPDARVTEVGSALGAQLYKIDLDASPSGEHSRKSWKEKVYRNEQESYSPLNEAARGVSRTPEIRSSSTVSFLSEPL